MNANRLVVAITGGIAAGKSEVTRGFERLGIAVADADVIARELVEPGQPALAAIIERFGSRILREDGRLDRAALRQIVFEDNRARLDLEAILHPRIRTALHTACAGSGSAYAIAAIPLLTEAGGRAAYPWLGRILVVDVPRQIQLRRLVARDGSSATQAVRILDAQATREQRLAIADDVIDNSGTMDTLAPQIARLHTLYLALAGSCGW